MEINWGRNFHENQFGQQISIRVSWFAEVQLLGAGGSAVDLLLTFAPTHLLQEGTLHTRSATLHTHLPQHPPTPLQPPPLLCTLHTQLTHSGQVKWVQAGLPQPKSQDPRKQIQCCVWNLPVFRLHISPFAKCELCVWLSPQLMPSLKAIYAPAVIYIWQLAVNYCAGNVSDYGKGAPAVIGVAQNA